MKFPEPIRNLKRLKTAFSVAAISLLAGCALSSYLLSPHLPGIDGSAVAPGLLEEATIIRDVMGIPHILAQTEEDAYFSIGYVHAQDRLFQMEMMRRIVRGTVSEIIGIQPLDEVTAGAADTRAADRLMKTIGLYDLSQKQYELMDEKDRVFLVAYAEGVNAWSSTNSENLPLEFELLGYKPEPWTPVDSIAVGRYYAFLLSFNWRMELTRAVIGGHMGEGLMNLLLPIQKSEPPYIVPPEMVDYAARATDAGIKTEPIEPTPFLFDNMITDVIAPSAATEASIIKFARFTEEVFSARGAPRADASNNWIISGDRSRSKKPILANDTHMPHLMPGLYYPVVYKYRGRAVFGFGFAGMPYVMMGANGRLAWGVTTNLADCQDLYLETVDPKDKRRYRTASGYKPFGVRTEQFCYKNDKKKQVCEPMRIRYSDHGPIITDALGRDDLPPLALSWTGYYFAREPGAHFYGEQYQSPSTVKRLFADEGRELINDIGALREMSRAGTVADFEKAARGLGAPIMNWVAADASGSIGYFAYGLLPIRKKGNGSLPAPGADGEYDWSGFVDTNMLPSVIDPTRGYLASANNRPVGPDYPYYWADMVIPPYRAARITELLADKLISNASDSKKIQLDLVDVKLRWLKPLLIEAWQDRAGENQVLDQAMKQLEKAKDLSLKIDAAAPTIALEAWRQSIFLTLSDEFDNPEIYDYYKANVWGLFLYDQILHYDSPLFDDRRTPNIENRKIILWRSLVAATKYLEEKFGSNPANWKWGRLVSLEFEHPFGKIAPLGSMLNRGPYQHRGGFDSPFSSAYTVSNENAYKVITGPASRHIVDLGAPNTIEMSADGGVSGVYKSPNYDSLRDLWLANGYHKIELDADPRRGSTAELRLIPGRK